MNEQQEKKDIIEVKELYFGKIGHGIKNPVAKFVVDAVFTDKVRKRKISYPRFSMSFEGTKMEWYTNFVNAFITRVKCFFTKDNDMFIVYPVLAKDPEEVKSSYEIPKEAVSYVKAREEEWQKKEVKWTLDLPSVQEEIKGEMFTLQYKGSGKDGDQDRDIFERIFFKNRDKVVLQAFIFKGSDQKVLRDIEKVAESIEMI